MLFEIYRASQMDDSCPCKGATTHSVESVNFDGEAYSYDVWVIEINSISELMSLGRVIVNPTPTATSASKLPLITLYDDYVE